MELFDYIELKVPAKSEYVGVLRLALSGIASRMGFTYDTIEDLKVALSEAATNVVTHAYEKDEQGELILGAAVYEDKIELMVSDQGDSFKLEEIKHRIGPLDVAGHDDALTSIREGGFGLLLINTLMDKVHFNTEFGVTVFMTKYLERSGVEQNDQVQT